MPDLVPIARWVLAGFAVLLALGVAAARSPALGDDPAVGEPGPVLARPVDAVTDPVFGRDIGFFLFELPFLRLVQSLVNGLLLASLVVAGARYLLAGVAAAGWSSRPGSASTSPCSAACTCSRSRSATSSTSTSSSTARAASRRASLHRPQRAVPGLRRADVPLGDSPRRFLVAGAFTRWMWPLGAVLIIWFLASIVLGRVYPEAVQRFTVDPNKYAQEKPYIANNIAMTRLAFGLDQLGALQLRGRGAADPARRS